MNMFEMMGSDDYSLGTIGIESDYNYQGIFMVNLFNKLYKLGVDSKFLNHYKYAFDKDNSNMRDVRNLISTLDTINEQHKLGSINDEIFKNMLVGELNKYCNIGVYYSCTFEEALIRLLDSEDDCMIRRKSWEHHKCIGYDFIKHKMLIYDNKDYEPKEIESSVLKVLTETDLNATDWEVV